jgi:hypothetical protein
VEIMIPLAATREELSQVREELEPVAAGIPSRSRVRSLRCCGGR